MKNVLLALALLASVVLNGESRATDHATPDEAKTLAVKAATYLKENGPDKAFALFNEKQGQFVDRDLYVYALDATGTGRAHPFNPALIGRNLSELKDVDGKPFVQEILAAKDTAQIDYKWLNPVSKSVEAKSAFVNRVGEYFVVVGAYKQ